MLKKIIFYFLALFVLLSINENFLDASHFRGGSMTATPKSYNSTFVVMTITTHWA